MFGQHFHINEKGENIIRGFNNNFIVEFIQTELCNKAIKNDLIYITKMENIISYEYECNQYNVILNRLDKQVIIKDAVSEENGVSEEYTRYTLSLSDFIQVLNNV